MESDSIAKYSATAKYSTAKAGTKHFARTGQK
jgi:hypothetical protein